MMYMNHLEFEADNRSHSFYQNQRLHQLSIFLYGTSSYVKGKIGPTLSWWTALIG